MPNAASDGTLKLFCAMITRGWLANPAAHASLAAAITARTPIRLLLMPGVRVPETLAQGAQDLAVFRVPLTKAGQPDAVAAALWIGEQMRALGPEKGRPHGD